MDNDIVPNATSVSLGDVRQHLQMLMCPSVQLKVRLPEFASPASAAKLRTLLRLFGCSESTQITAGWWNGFNNIGEYQMMLGKPLGKLCLRENSDLDWTIWHSNVSAVIRCVSSNRYLPGFLISPLSAQWLFESPPSVPDAFMYPLPTTKSEI